MSFKLSVSNRKRLRKNFFLFNSFCLVVCHICSFVSLKSELTIICLVLLIKSWNFSFRTRSLLCMLFAILKSHWFFNSCWILIKSWVWRSSDNVSFVVSTCLLKCFNCLIHCFSLIHHISNFSKTCRINDALNIDISVFRRQRLPRDGLTAVAVAFNETLSRTRVNVSRRSSRSSWVVITHSRSQRRQVLLDIISRSRQSHSNVKNRKSTSCRLRFILLIFDTIFDVYIDIVLRCARFKQSFVYDDVEDYIYYQRS